MRESTLKKLHIGEKTSYNKSYMKNQVILRLNTNPAQIDALARLQAAFAEACSSLGPVVAETRCWNRVALHHLTYRKLRESFPALGAQMACNAIYSVSRSARLIFQNPASPWSIDKNPEKALPTLKFAESAPVYFDRHTFSIRQGQLSMYTLDGRLKFEGGLSSTDEHRFHQEKLKEIVLSRDSQGFYLVFSFGENSEAPGDASEMPQYILILNTPAPALAA